VHERLEHAGLPPLVLGDDPPQVGLDSWPDRVDWIFSKDGTEVMRFVIAISPSGTDRTKLHVTLLGISEGKFGDVAARLGNDLTLRNLYMTAIREQVDAVLTDHPFRYSAISGAKAGATVAHMRRISNWTDVIAEAQHAQEGARLN
jgi:hypothetical protein